MLIRTKTIMKRWAEALENRGVLFSSNGLWMASFNTGENNDVTNRSNSLKLFIRTLKTNTNPRFD